MGSRSLPGPCVLVVVVMMTMVVVPPGDFQSTWNTFSWMWYDHFDEIDDHMRTVDAQNCRSKAKEELVLRPDTVSQLPVYNQLLDRIWYPNRTSLIHLHNMALNRAFFYSYILQKMNSSSQFFIQPNWLYMYMSAAADVNANPNMINGSAVYFDQDCYYPNWYVTIPFNNTIPLFGPKAWRHDDYNDQENLLREPTRQVVEVADLGAGTGMNYTHPAFKMNPWYTKWLPDLRGDMDSLTKFTYHIGIKYSDQTGRFTHEEFQAFPFFGPASPSAQEKDERKLPVVFTQPYFDCGRSNKWIVSAVSPIVDFMPRYSNWTHLRRQRIVGVVVTDTDFIELDFNACGTSAGNPGPSYLSGIDRCQKSTGCKVKIGYGFKRGGYICHCKPGHAYPWNLKLPYQGENIEQATDAEYKEGFKCTHVDHRLVLPKVDNLEGINIEGASNQFSSGGVRLDVDSNNNNASGKTRRHAPTRPEDHPHFLHNDYYNNNNNVDGSSYRVRNLQSIDENDDDDDGDDGGHEKHRGGLKFRGRHVLSGVRDDLLAKVVEESLRSGGGGGGGGGNVYHHPYSQEKKRKDNRRMSEQHPKPEAPYGVHADIEAVHDRKWVSRAHVEEVLQRRRQEAAAKRREKQWTNLLNDNENITTLSKRRRKRSSVFDEKAFDRMMRIFRHMAAVTAETCHTMAPHNLVLAGDVAYGADRQFESEARTALRLSHFLCNFLQNTDPLENFGNLRGGGRLHIEHLFAEVVANVMSNFKVYSSGVFFDRYQFQNMDGTARELFGPWAFRRQGVSYALDTAGLSSRYTDSDWFQTAKGRWATNFKGLKTYKMRPYIRSNPGGTSSIRHEYFPMEYKAPTYQAGYWTNPHFRCDGQVDAWVITYVTPFFGLDTLKRKLQFKGVVTVDVPLSLMELNQCPQGFGVANAFKNTARCDFVSTWCRPQMGFPFMRGAYRCDCRRGFEYHHLDGKFWIEGSLVELEYEKKRLGLFSRFDELKCRVAGASKVSVALSVLLAPLLCVMWV